MTDKPAARVHVNLRLRQAAIDQAETLARENGLRKADVLRLAIAAGFANTATLDTLIQRARAEL